MIDTLPIEVIIIILKYLPINDILSLSVTCKLIHQCYNSLNNNDWYYFICRDYYKDKLNFRYFSFVDKMEYDIVKYKRNRKNLFFNVKYGFFEKYENDRIYTYTRWGNSTDNNIDTINLFSYNITKSMDILNKYLHLRNISEYYIDENYKDEYKNITIFLFNYYCKNTIIETDSVYKFLILIDGELERNVSTIQSIVLYNMKCSSLKKLIGQSIVYNYTYEEYV